mmetsp:Transcript_65918/g.176360  ORF Transcript_65918/g.176360 Transcript_65918/m.176360 type:complete len:264 (-) Transcript_65918:454-1245(-)
MIACVRGPRGELYKTLWLGEPLAPGQVTAVSRRREGHNVIFLPALPLQHHAVRHCTARQEACSPGLVDRREQAVLGLLDAVLRGGVLVIWPLPEGGERALVESHAHEPEVGKRANFAATEREPSERALVVTVQAGRHQPRRESPSRPTVVPDGKRGLEGQPGDPFLEAPDLLQELLGIVWEVLLAVVPAAAPIVGQFLFRFVCGGELASQRVQGRRVAEKALGILLRKPADVDAVILAVRPWHVRVRSNLLPQLIYDHVDLAV